MIARFRKLFASLTICALLWTVQAKPAMANSIPTKSDEVWIVVGVLAIGAAIGVGVYLAVRPHSRGITGCASSGPNGLQLVSESDQQTYALTGDVGGIKSGERIRLSGKKRTEYADMPRQFLVEKLNKDLGPCTVAPAGP
jgi:hypothetical protein